MNNYNQEKRINEKNLEEDIKDWYEDIKDWILRKLGHPLVTVELTHDHLKDAIEEALAEFAKYELELKHVHLKWWVRKYALALCKITLGIIRSKFQGIQLLGGGKMDSSIKEEGICDINILQMELKNRKNNIW